MRLARSAFRFSAGGSSAQYHGMSISDGVMVMYEEGCELVITEGCRARIPRPFPFAIILLDSSKMNPEASQPMADELAFGPKAMHRSIEHRLRSNIGVAMH